MFATFLSTGTLYLIAVFGPIFGGIFGVFAAPVASTVGTYQCYRDRNFLGVGLGLILLAGTLYILVITLMGLNPRVIGSGQ
jgi:hypothetical protein